MYIGRKDPTPRLYGKNILSEIENKLTKKKENMNPTKEEFKNLRKTMSNKELAILLKVSMPTVYKIAKQLGCEKKKMGARPKTILKD